MKPKLPANDFEIKPPLPNIIALPMLKQNPYVILQPFPIMGTTFDANADSVIGRRNAHRS